MVQRATIRVCARPIIRGVTDQRVVAERGMGRDEIPVPPVRPNTSSGTMILTGFEPSAWCALEQCDVDFVADPAGGGARRGVRCKSWLGRRPVEADAVRRNLPCTAEVTAHILQAAHGPVGVADRFDPCHPESQSQSTDVDVIYIHEHRAQKTGVDPREPTFTMVGKLPGLVSMETSEPTSPSRTAHGM